jgi:two-component system, OmpR family, response regulator RegX3
VRILLVEDDPSIAGSLTDSLVGAGFVVDHAPTGRAALAADACDLVLLDLGLPDIDGYSVFRGLRAASDVPIIVITARGDELDRVLGLELGADDYVVKPFSSRELVARIRAVARRAREPQPTGSAAPAVQRHGPLVIDERGRRVALDDLDIPLTSKEFDVLTHLAADAGAVHRRSEILSAVWDTNWYGTTKTVDAHVAAIRKKLGDPRWIVAVRGVGFRFEVPGP